MLARVGQAIARCMELTIGLIFCLILVLSLLEVVSRYFTGYSLVWVVESNRFLFIWLVFIAAAVCFHRRLHFRVVLLRRALSPALQAKLEVGIDLISLGFAAILLVQSLHIVSRTSIQRSPALLIPMSYVYLVVPLSAALIIVFILVHWADALATGRLAAPAPDGH
jgi:TRAP-type C4-dicarboxylate transport system permease small subunit